MMLIRCEYVPPYVTENLVESGAVAAESEYDRSARDKRASRAPERSAAEAALATVTSSAAATAAAAAAAAKGASRREVWDSETDRQQRVKLVRAEGDPTTADDDVTAAYEYSGLVRSFFREMLGRDSIDNAGLDLVLNVHFGSNYMNAFWDGDEMTFGDGDGTIFTSFVKSLDVVAHELGHGVTQHTAGLVYRDQSGALNEHFSDVFGTAITQWSLGQSASEADWLVGNEIMGPTLYGEALRSMRAPGTAYDNALMGKDPQPAHMSGLYSGAGDNGGVHINSGIPNRAFFLVATGLNDTMAATRIWYHALQRLWSNATFAEAVDVLAESARILVKSGEAPLGAPQLVRAAFRSVGL